MGEHPPVVDWTTDFDHTDDAWAADPYPIWDELREKCPVAHTERYGGVWLPTKHADVAAIAYDTEHFSSRSIIVSEMKAPAFMEPQGIAPPISSDPPYHHDARRMLLPIFSPQNIDKLEPSTRAYCHELIDAQVGKDVVDAAEDYAQHIPVRVIANMLGLPEEDADIFRSFVHHMLEGVAKPLEQRADGMMGLFAYLRDHIQDHVDNPRDDLIRFLLDAEIAGEKLDGFQVGRTIALLLIAGIDTTWSSIGASIWHLAKTAADRVRLVAEPGLMPLAIEELLRAYARDDGALGTPGHGLQRLPDEGERLDSSVVPCGQPRSQRLRARRRGHPRPRAQPARRLWTRRPPVRRIAPGAHGDARRPRGVARALPRLRARRSRRSAVVGGTSARPTRTSGPSRSLTAFVVGSPSPSGI